MDLIRGVAPDRCARSRGAAPIIPACELTVRALDQLGYYQHSITMKVTTKGQVTIPARIRDYLGIVPHCDVDFSIRDEQVVLTKLTMAPEGGQSKFASMRGILGRKLTTDQWMKATRGD